MCFYLGYDDKAMIFADTRISTEKNGISYYLKDGMEKLRQFGNKVVFCGGDLNIANLVFNFIDDQCSIEDIQEVAIDCFGTSKRELAVYVMQQANNKYHMYQMASQDGFKIDHSVIEDYDVGVSGANCDEALEYFGNRMGQMSPLDAIKQSYQHVADNKVGGELIIYTLSGGDISKEIFDIEDNKPLRHWKDHHSVSHIDMSGQAIFKKVKITDGNNTMLMDSTIRKFYMNNWDIEGVGSLDAQFIQAGTLTAEDGFINNLTVNALKTLDQSDAIGDSVDYVYAKEKYIKLVTGTITNREQAQDGNGNLLYWTDGNKTMLTTQSTSYPFYDLTYDPVDKFKLYLQGQGVDSFPVMELGRGDGVTATSARAFIQKPADGLGISYHRSNTGAIREVELTDIGITIKAHDNGSITIEGKNVSVVAHDKISLSAPNGYDFS
ncbi:hypothetical protein PMSM_20915 [Paenibacillus macquariensis subsp. macquariensis]|nr:hypothetical protein PMSM_20915 [Paenibacillus macquariensis subsp. macquariensis]